MEIIIYPRYTETDTPSGTASLVENKKHAKEYWKSVDATEKWMLTQQRLYVFVENIKQYTEKEFIDIFDLFWYTESLLFGDLLDLKQNCV